MQQHVVCESVLQQAVTVFEGYTFSTSFAERHSSSRRDELLGKLRKIENLSKIPENLFQDFPIYCKCIFSLTKE